MQLLNYEYKMQLYVEFPGVFNRSLCEEIPQDVSLEGHRAVFPLSLGLWTERRALENEQLSEGGEPAE